MNNDSIDMHMTAFSAHRMAKYASNTNRINTPHYSALFRDHCRSIIKQLMQHLQMNHK